MKTTKRGAVLLVSALFAVASAARAQANQSATDSTGILRPEVVTLAGAPEVVFPRVLAGFVAAGFTVEYADRSAGLLRSLPAQGPSTVTTPWLSVVQMREERIFRATILPVADSSRVVLTLTRRVHSTIDGKPEEVSDTPPSCEGARGRALRRCLDYVAGLQSTLHALARVISAQ